MRREHTAVAVLPGRILSIRLLRSIEERLPRFARSQPVDLHLKLIQLGNQLADPFRDYLGCRFSRSAVESCCSAFRATSMPIATPYAFLTDQRELEAVESSETLGQRYEQRFRVPLSGT